MFPLRNKFIVFCVRLCVFVSCLFLFFSQQPSESSYLPVTGSNIGIGTSTPVGALIVMSGNVGIGTWSPTTQLQVIGNVSVTDEGYGGGWDGSTNVPTKNAVYDQVQSLIVGGAGGWTDGGTNVYTSTTTDNVGIGTTTATAALLVENVGTQDSFRVNDEVLDSSPFIIDPSGNVGIGTSSPVALLEVQESTTQTSGTYYGIRSRHTLANTSDSSVQFYGIFNDNYYSATANASTLYAAYNSILNNSSTYVASSLRGVLNQAYTDLSANTTTQYASYNVSTNRGTATTNYGTYSQVFTNSSGNTGTAYGAYNLVSNGGLGSPTTSTAHGTYTSIIRSAGTIGFGYGLYVGSIQATNPYSIYTSDSSAPSYFAGNVGIGTYNPVSKLVINGGVGIGTTGSSAFINTAAPSGGLLVENNVGIGTTTSVGALTVMNGNVGIGTWSPTQRLQVIGTVDATYLVGDGSGLTNVTGANSGWTDGGTNVYTSTTTDNVGIGTTTPTAALLIENVGTQASFRVNDAVLDGTPFIINSEGNVGIGTSSPNAQLEISKSLSGSSNPIAQKIVLDASAGTYNTVTGNTIDIERNSGGPALTNMIGSDLSVGNYTAGTVTNSKGINIFVDNDAAASSTTNMYGVHSRVELNSGTSTDMYGGFYSLYTYGTATNAYGLKATLDNSTSVSNFYGLHLSSTLSGGTTTNAYGIYVDNLAGTNTWGLYQADASDKNYFAGNVGIGTFVPRGGLIVASGNVGIGTLDPVGALTVMNGNVGIGTWSPTQRLQVIGTVDATAFVGDGSGLTNVTGTNSGWADGGTNVYTSTTTDNVGIGTTTPTAALLVENAGTQDSFRINDDVLDGTPFVINSAGNVGVGTSNPTSKVDVTASSTITSGNYYLSNSTLRVSPGGASTANLINSRLYTDLDTFNTTASVKGIYNEAFLSTGASPGTIYMIHNKYSTANTGSVRTIGSLVGNYNELSPSDSGITTSALYGVLNFSSPTLGTISNFYGVRNVLINMATVTNAYGINNNITNLVTMENAYGVYSTISNAGTLTNAFGVYIDTVQASNRWSLYSSDSSAPSYFAGNIGVGTHNPVNKLVVNGGVGIGTTNSSSFINTSAPSGGLIVENNVGIGTTTPVGALTVMNGNVGIGTWSPTQRLQVIGTVDATAFVGDGSGLTNVTGTNSGWTDGGTNVYTTTTTDNVGIGTTTPSTTLEIVKQGTQSPLMVSSAATGDGDYLLVGSSGNIGIGTSSPSAKLEINPAAATQGLLIKAATTPTAHLFNIQDSSSNAFFVVNSAGNLYVNTAINNGSTKGLYFNDLNGGWSAASITATKTAGSNNLGTLDISTGNVTNQLYLESAGNVGIGTATPIGALTVMNGNVGIGTWSPIGQLEVRGGSGATRIWTGAGTDTNATAAGELYVQGDLEVDGTIYGDGSGLTGTSGLTVAGGWTDGGTNVYTSTTTDNVGIGTTTPITTLDVMSNANSPYVLRKAGSTGISLSASWPTLGLNTWHTGSNWQAIGAGYTGLWNQNPNTGVMTFSIQNISFNAGDNAGNYVGAERMVITPPGNVGIGTTTPVGALTIMNGNVGIGTWSPTAKLEVAGGGDASFSTNVGIGTVSPLYSLEVIGTGRFSSAVNTPKISNLTTNGFVKTSGGDGTLSVDTGTYPTASMNAGYIQRATSSTAIGDSALFQSGNNIGIGTISPVGALTVMNGNVGIGTWSPTRLLSVNGNAQFGANTSSGTAAPLNVSFGGTYGTNLSGTVGNLKWDMYNDGASSRYGIGMSTNLMEYQAGVNGGHAFFVSQGTHAMTITSLGNVGIGTVTPSGMLDVRQDEVRIWTGTGTDTNATAAGELYVQGDLEVDGTIYGDGSGLTGTSGLTVAGGWSDGGTNVYTTTTTDNVGIGTTTPLSKLSVRGTSADVAGGLAVATPAGTDWRIYASDTGSEGGTAGFHIGANTAGFEFWIGGYGTSVANMFQSPNSATGATVAVVRGVAGQTGNLFQIRATRSSTAGDLLTVNASGNVGIGTTAPRGGLIVMNGNVGIGTTSPGERLQLSGNIGLTVANSKITGATGLTLEQTGDQYGTTRLHIQSRDGVNGAMFEAAGSVDLVDFVFKGLSNQRNIRYENRGGALNFAGTPEFQIGSPGNPAFTISDSVSLFRNKVGIGTSMPVGALAVMSGNVGIGTWSPRARLQVNNAINFTSEYDNGNSGASPTVDWTLGNKQKITLNNNATFTFAAPGGVTNLLLRIVQDGTGGRTAAWPASVKWPSGSAPTLSAAASAEDVITCYYQGTNYYCTATFNFQ